MNILIDGHAFLNVSTSIVKNMLLQDRSVGEHYYVRDVMSDSTFILKQRSKDKFRQFALNYLGSIIAPFKENIASVFIVFDSKSWRRQFITDHSEEHGGEDFTYKKGRQYDERQYLFFDYFQNELLPILIDEYGIITSKVLGAEGDDLIAYICENIQEDICIWSVDKDLTQLLENEDRKVIMIMPKMMTKFKKVYTSDDFDKIEKVEVDLFNFDLGSIDNSAVVNIVNDLVSKNYQHISINPIEDIIKKIVSGDNSDTIPRAHQKITKSKVARILEDLREKVEWDTIKDRIDSGDPELLLILTDIICDILKIKDLDERQSLLLNLGRNRKLMRLSTAVLPDELCEAITESINLEDRRRFDYFKFKKNYRT